MCLFRMDVLWNGCVSNPKLNVRHLDCWETDLYIARCLAASVASAHQVRVALSHRQLRQPKTSLDREPPPERQSLIPTLSTKSFSLANWMSLLWPSLSLNLTYCPASVVSVCSREKAICSQVFEKCWIKDYSRDFFPVGICDSLMYSMLYASPREAHPSSMSQAHCSL